MTLTDCGCCEGITLETPVGIVNRPGLSAIAYRVGTHGHFKASMLSRLSASELRELGKLKTRDEDDFTIALLDGWALVSDILTFYQERIANESYLRTATERASIVHLARLIGYELRPGVAASTYLAFTLETGTGAPAAVTLDERLRVSSIPGPGEKPQTFETVESIDARPEWNALIPRLTRQHFPGTGETETYLAGVTTNLKAGDALLFVGAEREKSVKSPRWQFRRLVSVEPDAVHQRTLVKWAEPLGKKTDLPKDPKVYALRLHASLFGYNAPLWKSLPVALRIGEVNPHPTKTDHSDLFLAGAYADREVSWAEAKLGDVKAINLDSVYTQLVVDSWIVLAAPAVVTPPADKTSSPVTSPAAMEVYSVTAVDEEAKADFNITAKTTRLTISGQGIEQFAPRTTAVFAQSEELRFAETPIGDPLEGKEIELDRVIDGLTAGRTLIVTDGTVSEVVQLDEATLSSDGERTLLKLAAKLDHAYDRNKVTIPANVAFSTHGETVADEVLGSGDAGRAYQAFTLKQSPLTYTPADTATGGESTLAVRVNDLLWSEAATLFGHGPRERIYVTHIDDDAATTVEFGDGQAGVRLPMGHENVHATYRKGIGLDGLVGAGQLSLLMTRPLGVKSVINMLPAEGAQDPQVLADARANSPLTVLTLDRIVSLRDYEDFSRSFSGIAKASSTWTWTGQTRGVFITVAGIDGAEVGDSSPRHASLLSAMQKAGNSFLPITLKSYRSVTFRVIAGIKVDPIYIQENVMAAVSAALRSSFSFDARAFGQPVTLSEVIAVMQNVAGVVAVDVNQLYRKNDGVNKTILPAESPQPGAGPGTLAAELLTLDPGEIELAVMP